MTGRGPRGNPPPRPPSPADHTLESRPAPSKHRFPLGSFGPGVSVEIKGQVTSVKELDRAASDDPASQISDATEDRDLLKSLTRWENASFWADGRSIELDPTWGYPLFLTDYSHATLELLPDAMEKLVKVQQRRLGLHTNMANLYANEVFRRLKFDVVMDREALEGASIDRVRECIRALVRSLELCDDENEYPPPARNVVCLVLDAAKVEMLSNIEFYDDRIQEARALKECKLKAVSIHWKRLELTRDSYRCVRGLRVNMFDRTYELLDIQTLDQVEA